MNSGEQICSQEETRGLNAERPVRESPVAAVFGTTISPYLFFWQASQEVEEVRNTRSEKPLKRAPSQATEQLTRIRVDTFFGMAFLMWSHSSSLERNLWMRRSFLRLFANQLASMTVMDDSPATS